MSLVFLYLKMKKIQEECFTRVISETDIIRYGGLDKVLARQ